jgi:methylenetetrahydrofolate dehydrogenase (NADP+)/methenyltetrahydrofolate cyclohydrolase
VTAKRIDGQALAAKVLDEVKADVGRLVSRPPGLAVIIVGDDPASKIYVAKKGKKARELGFRSETIELPETITEDELLDVVNQLNNDVGIHGILVQLPLPPHISTKAIIDWIDPFKDVDGFHPYNIGRLAQRDPSIIPCTPLGCLMLLKEHLGEIRGMKAVVVGASNIVGRPMSQLLLLEGCTVTVTHRFTRDTAAEARQADIVVAAVGKPGLVRADWIKPGATVIDVGINRVDGKVVGDVAYDEVAEVAGAITPVPGGVGPMTIACLMKNTLVQAQTLEQRLQKAMTWAHS